MKKILFCLVLLFFGGGCQSAMEIDTGPISSPTSTKLGLSIAPTRSPTSQIDQIETVTPFPTQLTEIQPSPEIPGASENSANWEGDQMPIFLEVSQITILKDDSAQGPTLGVGPTIYFYHPDNKVLMLHATVKVDAKTKVLIGVTNVLQTPNQKYQKKEIVQFPLAQSTLIHIKNINSETGIITILYEGQEVEISSGETRTFKQAGSVSNVTNVVTIVTNHGYIADIQPISPGSSWR